MEWEGHCHNACTPNEKIKNAALSFFSQIFQICVDLKINFNYVPKLLGTYFLLVVL